ncbi:SMC hinge domain-containing protein [Mycena kentingensis (nom. inval.)]|nr:SMC hinge domain-containing protein [Mycena kentingensis (nom. inval.)]
MPPRRTSRSTRASVEPQPEPVPAKRKREIEKENVRSRTKLQPSLQEDPEEDSPPPVKKSRPSLDPATDDDDEEKPAPAPSRRGRRTPAPKPDTEDDDDDDEVVAKPKRASRRAVASDDEEEDAAISDEYEEDVKPAKKAAKPKRAPTKAKAKAPPKPKASVSASRPPPSPIKPPPTQMEEGEDDEEVDKFVFEAPPMPTPAQLVQPAEEEPSGPKARLVIHKMALVNFKSYAGRQEIGPFHKSFSAIVGPNGSGKSNTIDALLFVFGWRASKMRQGKLSELIHNSAAYQDLDECSVEIHFRDIFDLPGPDAFEIVPDTNLIVTRTAYKNNSSKYTINGRSSTFTEVQTLLKDRGIDLDHKRFLILQGEVESIAQMKPKGSTEHEDGLLEYLEDIIGTTGYVKPISESMAQIEVLQEDRTTKLQRLRLVEKEKNALEDKKRDAENYLRLKNEKVRAENLLYQWDLWKFWELEKKATATVTKLEEELNAQRETYKDDIAHVELLKKDYEERKEIYKELQAAAAKVAQELAQFQKKQVQNEERHKHANTRLKKLNKSLTEDKAALSKAKHVITDSNEKAEKERANIQELERDLAKEEKVLEEIRDSLKDKTQVFHDQIEAKQKELQPWTNKIDAKKAEVDNATSERDALAKKAKAVKDAIDQATESLQQLETDQQGKHAQLDSYKADKKTRQTSIAAIEKKQKDAHATIQELKAKVSTNRQKVAEAKHSMAENTSQNKVVDGLMRLKSSGRIAGFHGRLGSLGAIPDKYDVAISTACGQLHNMVVDRVDQAQECIQYLREQNLGRATFMVLDKLSEPNMGAIATPENVPRLFDLVKSKDPKFAKAFWKALGNTLVAENMDQANRIAFGARRWRVVTLAGQLIETTGAMSGGGNQPARGAMSSKLAADAVRPEVLRQMEAELGDAEKKLDQALREAQAQDAELDGMRRSLPEMETAFQKLGMDIEIGKTRISEATKRLSELKTQNKPNTGDAGRIASLNQSIAKYTEELERLEDKAREIEEALEELQEKIKVAGGSKFLTQKSRVDGIRLHINLANDEITKAEVARTKADKDVTKLSKAIETDETSRDEAKVEVDELNDVIAQLQTQIDNSAEGVKEAKIEAEASKDNLDEIKQNLDQKEEGVQAFKQKELEIEQNIAEAEKEREQYTNQVDELRDTIDQLVLEEIDDDDSDDEDENKSEKPAGPSEPTEPSETTTPTDVKMEVEEDAKPDREGSPSDNGLHTYSAEELAKFKRRDLLANTELLDEKLGRLKPDLDVLRDYKEREKEFFRRVKDVEVTTKARDAEKQKYDGLRKKRLDEFMTGFNLISMKLKEMYQMITLGGNAELELVDSMDPFSEGIIFSVMPPKKSWKNISNLSGGEKTLSSLALVFALHVFKPTPLYFMDEIDAALDFRNVSIVANYIKDRTKNAQFIIISLRNDMFELSHRLIGIYKTSNATRSMASPSRITHCTLLSLRARRLEDLFALYIQGICI